MQLKFRGLTEDAPGKAWKQVHEHGWPGWSAWFLSRGGRDGPSLGEAQRALIRHMPEMEPLWHRLVDAVGGNDDLARFLSFWSPPRYLVSCSQAVILDGEGPLLIRNYDLDPRLNESTMLHTAWRGRRVMGMVEGLAGLSDGINEVGLAASLTFGGRTISGPGFGIPLIMRYLLEICNDVEEAVELLRAVPCHMSYNVTVADRSGAWKTVFLAPDRPAIVSDRRITTNHQLGVEIPSGHITRTVEREEHLEQMISGDGVSSSAASAEFLAAPLFSTGYDRGFGTVFTAAYRPAAGEGTLSWHDGSSCKWQINDFKPSELEIEYTSEGSRAAATGQGTPRRAAPGSSASAAGFLEELAAYLAKPDDWTRLAAYWQGQPTVPDPARDEPTQKNAFAEAGEPR